MFKLKMLTNFDPKKVLLKRNILNGDEPVALTLTKNLLGEMMKSGSKAYS